MVTNSEETNTQNMQNDNQPPLANKAQKNTPEKGTDFVELIKFILLALVIVIPIRTFFIQPFVVNGASMEPTFSDKDYLIVDQFSYILRSPERGESVVFKYPDKSKHLIKRVIGLPGDTVTIKDNVITVQNTDTAEPIEIAEPFITDPIAGNFSVTLEDEEYFVLGDNRDNSLDSRRFGKVPEKTIRGRAFIRLYPFETISTLPGDHRDLYNLTDSEE